MKRCGGKNFKYFKYYATAFIYLLLITILISLSTIVLHELGHFIFSYLVGCQQIKIILSFDNSNISTYTEMACPQSINTFLLGISGFFIVLPISLLFFLISSGGEKYLALIMIGFNFIVSASDFEVYLKLPLSDIITILIGSVIIVVGETLLIEKLVF